MKKLMILIFVFISFKVQAQCPGYFYTFVLEDADGNIIDASNTGYTMKTIKYDSSSQVALSISVCDKKIRVFYEQCEGSENINTLKIQKSSDDSISEAMFIEFSPTRYKDVYAGEIKFKQGTYRTKLPETFEEWGHLKRIKLCSNLNDYEIFDISEYQK